MVIIIFKFLYGAFLKLNASYIVHRLIQMVYFNDWQMRGEGKAARLDKFIF